MTLRPGTRLEFALRGLVVRLLLGFLLIVCAAVPAQAQLLPEGFFDQQVHPGEGAAAVEADQMSYDGLSATIAADGDVLMSYQGYTIRADRLEYNQTTGKLSAVGHVVMRDPIGNTYAMDSIEVTGGMKEAFIQSLTVTTSDGGQITARDVRINSALLTVLHEATYSPCGLCIDKKGRKIGWKVKGAKMTYDREHAAVYIDQPSLEVLGIPIAWLPWIWVPDPTQPRAMGPRFPTVGASGNRGLIATTPYFVPVGNDIDLLLSPTFMTRQGFLMRGDLEWRFPGFGEIDVRASGLYQLDKSAFAGTVGDKTWRGAIQTSGRFTPTKDWVVGWSYNLFSDNQYVVDYEQTTANAAVNQLYATNLTDDTYIDGRIQHYNLLGNTTTDDPAQANILPDVKYQHFQDLAPGFGRVTVSGEVLGINRGADQVATTNAVPYVSGYQGNKAHLELEGAWENQWILPGGVTATPYLGARLDASYYDRSAAALPAPYPTQTDASLFSVTPIAAMDFRWPLMATNGDDTHLLEPIAQLVYRGSSTTKVGITNDDAQSFVFDTSNLFSYNRFSGIDRQETGLRANIGGHYLGNFADGSWIDLVAGQSFQLVGLNALGVADAAQVGTSTGLGSGASYIVASAQGGFTTGIGSFSGGGKIQIDPATPNVTRAGLGVSYSGSWFSTGINYIYLQKNAALGTVADEHEVGLNASVPVADYWTLGGAYAHNIATNKWASVSGSVTYDDGYFSISGVGSATPSSYGFQVHFGLKSPLGSVAF
jgi:LPS-assembly protein